MRKIGIIVALVMILSSMIVLGAATMRAPLEGGTVSGALYQLNVTLGADDDGYSECNFTAYSSSTANSTSTLIATATNKTKDQQAFNISFASTMLEDSNDYVFAATCGNDSTSLTSPNVGSIIVGNTNPTAPSAMSPADETSDVDGDITFTATVDDATTTGCTLMFSGINPGRQSYTMTYATTGCTVSLTNLPNQQYDWYVEASDGTDTTESAYIDLEVKRPGKYSGAASVVGQGRDDILRNIGILVVIGAIGWFVFIKKK